MINRTIKYNLIYYEIFIYDEIPYKKERDINHLSHLHLYCRILNRFNEILNYHSTLKFIMSPAVFERNLNK